MMEILLEVRVVRLDDTQAEPARQLDAGTVRYEGRLNVHDVESAHETCADTLEVPARHDAVFRIKRQVTRPDT